MISAWENLHFAILELVRSTPIKQRLIAAYRRHLVSISVESLPVEARELYEQGIRLLLDVEPLRGEDAVAASVRKMSVQEAEECASLIVEAFGILSRDASSARRRVGTEVSRV